MLLMRSLLICCTFRIYFHFQGLLRHASRGKKILPRILILLLLCTPIGQFLDTACVLFRSKKRPRFGGHFLIEFRVTPKCNALFGSRPRPQNWVRARCQHKGQKTIASPPVSSARRDAERLATPACTAFPQSQPTPKQASHPRHIVRPSRQPG